MVLFRTRNLKCWVLGPFGFWTAKTAEAVKKRMHCCRRRLLPTSQQPWPSFKHRRRRLTAASLKGFWIGHSSRTQNWAPKVVCRYLCLYIHMYVYSMHIRRKQCYLHPTSHILLKDTGSDFRVRPKLPSWPHLLRQCPKRSKL